VQPLDFEFVDCRQTTGEKWDERFDGVKATEGTSDADDGANANANALPDRFALDPRVVEAATALGLKRIVSVPVNHCAQSFALALESTPLVPGDETTTWKVVYSGDTRPCASLTAASKNATVLIHEATFEDDLHEDAVRKRHSTTSEAIQCGTDAGVYRTILTHFSQRYPKAPVFDDGNFGRTGFGEAENADEKKDGDAAKKDPETTTSRVGVAFDLMRVDFTSLPRLPTLNPKIRHLFPDPEQKFSENGGEDASREF
jgi:ribonuclease Z